MDKQINEPLLVSRKEAAALLGVSHGTMTNLVRAGELAPVRVGVRTLFRRRDLKAFSERNHHRTKPRKSTKLASNVSK